MNEIERNYFNPLYTSGEAQYFGKNLREPQATRFSKGAELLFLICKNHLIEAIKLAEAAIFIFSN